MAAHFGLGVMAYLPLAGGLLTGKYRKNETGRINLMKAEPQITDPRNEAILDTLIDIAGQTESSLANVAVAWINRKGFFPVIGPRAKPHLDDYLKSVDLKLTNEQMQQLDQVSAISLEYPHDGNQAQREIMMKNRL